MADFEPCATRNSTQLNTWLFWAAADIRVQTGLVVIDRTKECILVVRSNTLETDALPRGEHEDFIALLGEPLRQAEVACGHKCRRLQLPKMEKKYINNFREAVTCLTDEMTTDTIYMTFGTLWVETSEQPWPDGFQLITFWYAAEVDFSNALLDGAPKPSPDPSARWVPLEDALDAIKGDKAGSTVLGVFKQLWEISKRPPDQRIGSVLDGPSAQRKSKLFLEVTGHSTGSSSAKRALSLIRPSHPRIARSRTAPKGSRRLSSDLALWHGNQSHEALLLQREHVPALDHLPSARELHDNVVLAYTLFDLAIARSHGRIQDVGHGDLYMLASSQPPKPWKEQLGHHFVTERTEDAPVARTTAFCSSDPSNGK
ncbi:hypothetical protein EXIGLDRAFT_779380 [Exidia glandulosa HHB12029]|uniref:Uncharacterized protein n=1 Tax=Exidia glandulosa HHB12029 TaxID=1314781 RepID=A0A165C3J5_EXIGL|nr:hypothetical protein EXIGLDRAFT_779380 [Exidia glandulosa HHB12029]